MQRTLVFYVNGKQVEKVNPNPETTLLTYLRNELGLTGTKLGCGEGGCGACTVMVSHFDPKAGQPVHHSVNACLMPLCRLHGMAVTTVEGIGSTRTRLHAVQESLAKAHGSQCGFCTPGIIMSMYTLWRNNLHPTDMDLEETFQGNLCRCTGYRPILEGFRNLVKENVCPMGEACCLKNGSKEAACKPVLSEQARNVPLLIELNDQEVIFPPQLKLNKCYDDDYLEFIGERVTWFRPTNLTDLLELKKRYPDARLVVGNTEVGVEVKLKNQLYPVLICPSHVNELSEIQHTDSGISIGAAVTLSVLETTLMAAVTSMPEWKTRVYTAILEMLKWFAGKQIRNVAAVGGNIMTASPISDLNPIYMAAGATVEVASLDGGRRKLDIDDNFFLRYRVTALHSDEVLLNIHIPNTSQSEYFESYKQAHRKDDDIAIANAGMMVKFEEGTSTIHDICLVFGGMSSKTVMAVRTAKALKGLSWREDIIDKAVELLKDEIPLSADAPGGMAEFRKTLTLSFFYKFYVTVALQLSKVLPPADVGQVPVAHHSAAAPYRREPSCGTTVYEEPDISQASTDSVGRSLMALSAEKQCSGEAIFVDDIPHIAGELYLALVTSTRAHAKIIDIDATEALRVPGAASFFTHKDVPGSNRFSISVRNDELIFAEDEVTTQGQIIAAVVADSKEHAQRAAKAVRVTYNDLPAIITIEEAVKQQSFLDPTSGRLIRKGSVEQGLSESDIVLTGTVTVGGQEHFYLETQASMVVPKENDELEVFSSSQSPSLAQEMVAKAVGISSNHVTARVKRLGGGFGGKESRFLPVLLPVAIAAYRLQRPIRCMLDRDEDMAITGTRHPFLGKYRVGAKRDGTLIAVEIELYSNGGHTQDFSDGVLSRSMLHIDNAYLIPNVTVRGFSCRTNLPSNTAFRGFGGPQGMFIMEHIVTDVAMKLGLSQMEVRKKNMYQENDLTHANTLLINCNLRRCWDECIVQSNLETKRQEVAEFNRNNRWKKRGLAIIPTKYGLAFGLLWMNQAGAVVHIYRDGNVLVAHSGTEMGQGLHIKMIQIASRALGLDASRIYINETSTAVVPNMSPTAGSVSCDTNGAAVKAACEELVRRLEPYKAANVKGTWTDWVTAAYFDRVSLSATGFHSLPDIVKYDWEKNVGECYPYFTYGAACSEVEIDCLTGDHQVLQTDIVMDVGRSINPAIDIGQIEGAFVQGYGLYCLEQLKITPNGSLLTKGPGTYKIPGFSSIPIKFNVSLLKGSSNPKAVYSSKGIGEPPLFLAASAFFAIKEAIAAARSESTLTGPFCLDSPATPERIRMACVDRFTQQFPSAEKGTFKPWFIEP